MENQERDNSFKLNIGGPSIILLLTVLGLSVFAILAVRASYNGLKLSRATENSIATYYAGDARADEIFFEINEIAAESGYDSLQAEERISAIPEVVSCMDGYIVYEVPVAEDTFIRVILNGASDYSDLQITSHALTVESMDGYTDSVLEIEEIFIL